jgi:2-polyprenyl-3-methyl-5-hydroxy-6-metoxy-1,4-benzoquinol methylase
VACGLCGADDFDVLFESPPELGPGRAVADFMASVDRYDRYGRVVRCRGCRLAYTNPRPDGGVLARAYADSVDPDYLTEDSCRSINAHISLRVVKKFARGGRLLDVGCATGYFLNAARLEFEVTGVEPSRWAAEQARRLGLEVREGEVPGQGWPDGHFSVVTMNDVVEHVSEPLALLRETHRLLGSGGLLYLVTPDIDSLSARILRGRWWGLRPAHIYYFSPRTLTAMLARAGFEVVLLRSYGRVFTYGYWLSRLKNYPGWVHGLARRAIEGLGVHDKLLYLDTRDSMEVCARKVEPARSST